MRELTDDEQSIAHHLIELRAYVGLPTRKIYGALAVGLLGQRSQRQISELLDVPREWLR